MQQCRFGHPQAIATEIEMPAPSPDSPGLFRCAVPGSIGDAFAAVGFQDVGETDVHGTLTTSSADEYWEYMSPHPRPLHRRHPLATRPRLLSHSTDTRR